jgi:transcriptional regulator with XRE-family HTH domain
MNLVGREIARLRNEKDLTQEALTARCQLKGWDVERGTLAKLEAGLRQVTDWELWALASALEVGIADIFPANKLCRTFLSSRGKLGEKQRTNDVGGRKRS